MSTGLIVLGIILALLAAYVLLRKDVRDAQQGTAAKEALKDVTEANRPVSADELERVRQQYRRD